MTAKGNAGCWIVPAAQYTGPPVVPGPVSVIYVSDGALPLLGSHRRASSSSYRPLIAAPHPGITATALATHPQPATASAVNSQPAATFAMNGQSAAAVAVRPQPASAVVASPQLPPISALTSTSTVAVGTATLPAGYSFLFQVDPQIQGNRFA